VETQVPYGKDSEEKDANLGESHRGRPSRNQSPTELFWPHL